MKSILFFILFICIQNIYPQTDSLNDKNSKTMNYDIEKLMKTTGSIGAYAKEADNAFENLIRETSFGDFERMDWQLINFLNNNPKTTQTGIIEFLSFLDEKDEIENRIAKFEAKGIISKQKNNVLFTPIGKIAYDETYQIQKEILETSFKGISEEDYKVCIEVLIKMVNNMLPYIKQANN